MLQLLKTSILLSFLFLLSSCNSFSQKRDPLFTQTDSLIKVTEPKFNGVILISKKGKPVYSKAYGYADFDKKKPLTLNSQFEIMSNSKQITAVLLLKEVEKGRVDLQAPIKKYLPNLTQTWADSVTVHQLLNHTHGIINLQKPLLFKPGTDFKYGDLSFSLAGQIVAFSTKKKYSEVANALFKELKMKNTFCYDENKNRHLVTGYINDKNVFNKVEKTKITPENVPADGIISTVTDLSIWNNNLHKGKILKPETYQLMIHYSVKSQHNLFGKEKEGYGYGIRIVDQANQKYIGHSGLGDGFSSVNLYFPKSDVSLIILENQMNTNADLFYHTETKIKTLLLKSDLLTEK
ncbi:serine hydrolase domain-containing protein [Flavobacterium poyangense]|uniref:serine hydrolase domain-containing protein n=1 Tax=Flavobacterium poyangense TaxID=2204302 RepID=UPI0014226B06|nr:serine hydrolase domain-containing protein [Flavobacterium sp. JXAS1]